MNSAFSSVFRTILLYKEAFDSFFSKCLSFWGSDLKIELYVGSASPPDSPPTNEIVALPSFLFEYLCNVYNICSLSSIMFILFFKTIQRFVTDELNPRQKFTDAIPNI